MDVIVIKDDPVSAELRARPGSWMRYLAIAGLSLPLLYSLSSAPVIAIVCSKDFGGATDSIRLRERVLAKLYLPLIHTAAFFRVESILYRYAGLFAFENDFR